MASGMALIGLVLLVLTCLAVIISFATPYWVDHYPGSHDGIWAFCRLNSCTWTFENDFLLQRRLPDYMKAAQGLLSIGLVMTLLSLLLATLALCCECKQCSSNHAVGVLLLIGFLSLGAGIVVYAVWMEAGIARKYGLLFDRIYGWSFWLAIAAAGLSLVTSIIYACEGRRRYA